MSWLAVLGSLTWLGLPLSCSTETPLPSGSGGAGGQAVSASGGVSSGGAPSGGAETMGTGGQLPSSGGSPPAVGGGSGGSAEQTGGAESSGGSGGGAEEPAVRELFILFGQSNMAGSSPIEPQDRTEDPRIEVLGMYDCPELGRAYNVWSVAAPPLHSCGGELGPGDYFAKTLAAAWPDAQIGLIPNGVPAVEIDFFRKGMISKEDQPYKELPEDWNSAYDMMVARTLLAMETGRVRGILFHQGESDNEQSAWVGKVAEIIADLRADLGIGEAVPFFPGELPPTGCCGAHNTYVNQLKTVIPNTVVVSAAGLSQTDQHFDTASMRTLGERYADALLELMPTP